MSKRSKNRSKDPLPESDSSADKAASDEALAKPSSKWLPLDELIEPMQASDQIVEQEPSPPEPPKGFERLVFTVEEEHSDTRIDLYLTFKIDGYSRVFLRRVVAQGHVRVDGREVKPAFHVFAGQVIEVRDLPPAPTDGSIPEAIALDVLYEDEWLV
ncbi:MAG: S4 domain-containing protein, partial [Planctomycetota bacterium]